MKLATRHYWFNALQAGQPEPGPSACDAAATLAMLSTSPQQALSWFDRLIAFLTTPFKRLGIQGWEDTHCVAQLTCTPVRDAQHSTDGFWTIDVSLSSFAIGGAAGPAGRYLRIEVEPCTAAHAVCAGRQVGPADTVACGGRILIDKDGPFLEVHPTADFRLASAEAPAGAGEEPETGDRDATSLAEAPSLLRNWLSTAGIILAASSFFAAVCLIAIDSFLGFSNPYLGILTYLIAPAFLVAGLLLVAIGAIKERRRRRRLAPGEVPRFPRLDLNLPRQRRVFIGASVATFVFLMLTALGSYRTYEFTESVAFCGTTCHTIMKPEYTAYQESPHARVACVQCHIGPGASWFVRSKLSGAYQVYATIADRYPRPIPSPIKNLRPAQQTCEQCHWPRKFYGAAERVIPHYLPDEHNSPWTIRMLLHIGGGDPAFGPAGGIHWHMNIANRIEYVATDSQRQDIPWVRLTDARGRVTVYQSTVSPLTAAQLAAARPRAMDCIDCHNRPTHIYNAPATSVNLAISTGRIDSTLPFIKRQAVRALTGQYATTPDALRGIAASLAAFYDSAYPPDWRPRRRRASARRARKCRASTRTISSRG